MEQADPPAVTNQLKPSKQIPRATRIRIGVRALLLLGAPILLAFGLGMVLSQTGHGAVAQGIVLGVLLSVVVTSSWVGGAILTFDAPLGQFMGLTLWKWPLRILVMVLGLAVLIRWFGVHSEALFLSFLFAHVYGHVVEAITFNALAKACAPDVLPPPLPDEPEEDPWDR